MGEGSRGVEISKGMVLYFELNTKIHQFTVKKIEDYSGNFNKYRNQGIMLFEVTKKKGQTILKFFEMLELQKSPGTIENSFENLSTEYRKIFRRVDIEENFELTRSCDRDITQRNIEDNFEKYRDLPPLLEIEGILEIHPEGEVLVDVEDNFEQTSNLRTDIEKSFDDIQYKEEGGH
jgi:hypothetical protein